MPIIGRWLLRVCGLAPLLLLPVSVGCGPQVSQLETGGEVTTGKRPFDTYFDAVAKLRDHVDGLDSELLPVRRPLTEQLRLRQTVSPFELIAAVRKRVHKYRDYGVALNLRLTPEPKLLTVEGKLKMDPQDEAVLAAVETSATRAMTTLGEYAELLARAGELDKQRAVLAERIDQVSDDDDAYERIKTEIVAAGRVLDGAERKLLRDMRTLALFVVELARAVDTGAVAAEQERCQPAPKRKPPAKSRRRWQPRPAGPPADDFEM